MLYVLSEWAIHLFLAIHSLTATGGFISDANNAFHLYFLLLAEDLLKRFLQGCSGLQEAATR